MRVILENLNHHAYCLIGGADFLVQVIEDIEKNHKIERAGNSDFIVQEFESLTIDDARELRALHDVRPVHSSGKKIFIIRTDSINNEAQNALLKLLEEPASYAHFIFIIPSRHLLLPTVQSRILFIEHNNQNDIHAEMDQFVSTFLKCDLAKRLDIVKKIADDIGDDKKPKRFALEFVNALEKAILDKSGLKDSLSTLEVIQDTRKYLSDRAPSIKMLLERVVLSM